MDFGVGNRPLGVKTNQGIAHRFAPASGCDASKRPVRIRGASPQILEAGLIAEIDKKPVRTPGAPVVVGLAQHHQAFTPVRTPLWYSLGAARECRATM